MLKKHRYQIDVMLTAEDDSIITNAYNAFVTEVEDAVAAVEAPDPIPVVNRIQLRDNSTNVAARDEGDGDI